MRNSLGLLFKVSIFGESHGKGVGALIEGCSAGLELSETDVQKELDKRKPGQKLTTPRKEEDKAEIYSGVFNGRTTGAAIAILIRNQDRDSSYYEEIRQTPRPGHADYVAHEKYGGFNDYRGGGAFSGRLTAPLVAAGSVAKKLLAKNGVEILAHVKSMHEITVENASDGQIRDNVYQNPVRCADPEKATEMISALEEARHNGDSLGAVIECRVLNLPIGVGEPLADSVEGNLAKALLTIPAVKGIEFGSGFIASKMKGSEHNDSPLMEKNQVRTKTNNAGGILGGITNAMPLVVRVAFKPTSSIQKTQETINIREKTASELQVKGRHDPCVAIRAVPVVENVVAFTLADLMLQAQKIPRVL